MLDQALPSPLACRMQHCDDRHAIVNLAVQDHLQHCGEGEDAYFREFRLVGCLVDNGQLSPDVEMRVSWRIDLLV